jgi:SAM-dependent methyltransferase
MKKSGKKGKGHGHPWIVGIVGIIVAVVLYLHIPKLAGVSAAILLIALAHLILAGVVMISAYFISPQKIKYLLFEKRKMRKMEGKLYFGWSFGWMNMFWMAAPVFTIASVWVYIFNPQMIWLSLILFLISLNLWAGNFTLRASKQKDYMTLPFVDLFTKGSAEVLDAGCGSGRTTIGLSKVMKSGTITAFDRFDSDYIENGGKALIERNLKIEDITDRVKICEGDVTEMEFTENYFDAAISSFMMDHLGKYKEDALKEICRTLKPGGRFLLIVFVPGYATFSVFNVMCFTLTSRKGWRSLFVKNNFKLMEEGIINSGVYFLIEKTLQ